MYIRIKSYAGVFGFYLRKYLPNLCSNSYLFMQRVFSNIPNKEYMRMNRKNIVPLFVNIETVNRCNGNCSFCCCSATRDTRIFKEMDKSLFEKIIFELSDIEYSGIISLNINNEPFLDRNMIDKLRFVKKYLPNSYSFLYTNGSLLSTQKIDVILKEKLVDELIINNYNEKFKLNDYNKVIYNHLKKQKIDIKITINMRYLNEVLSNRANTSPNKHGSKVINSYCSIPFTDINIFPNGNVGLCCCDTKEVTNFGNALNNNIIDIYNNYKFKRLRRKMLLGRNANEFCKFCDFNDIGTRRKIIKNKIMVLKNGAN